MKIVRTDRELAPYAGGIFVPTMGALHEGHLALIRKAARLAGDELAVVVSVFVNPAQFNEPADFSSYRRDLDRDVDLAADAGATCVFAPDVREVYPDELDGSKRDPGPMPRVATEPGLEDQFRPGHFAGVVMVVRRLFDLVGPSAAVFGEKDWQQLQVVRALCTMDKRAIEIVAHETVRESDGLAMSSRNSRLNLEERKRAASLYRALCASQQESTPERAEKAMRQLLDREGVQTEYAVVRDAETLLPPERRDGPLRALIAGRFGEARLLDNIAWPG